MPLEYALTQAPSLLGPAAGNTLVYRIYDEGYERMVGGSGQADPLFRWEWVTGGADRP
jgi:hypothetical protein